jgi:serine phosphatase RsbU (regulator of sigma subunit)
VTSARRAHKGAVGAAFEPALAGSKIAVAILERGEGPDLAVAFANPAHAAIFGWRTGSVPRPARRGKQTRSQRDLTDAVRDAAATVLRTGDPVRLGEVPAGDRFLHIECSAVRARSAVTGVTVVSVDVTDQVRARRQAEDQHQRLSVLDEATTAVAAEIEPRRELIALAESVVPGLADACAIYLVDHTPYRGAVTTEIVQATRLVCVINPALGLPPPAPEIRLRLAPTRPVTRAARDSRAVLASGPAADPTGWGEHWLTVLDPHSLVAVPIGTPDAVRAVISFAAVGDRPRYRDSDIALMHEITARVDVAVGRALRLQQTSEVALTLQRGLLSEPPEVDGLEVEVRYRPAGPGVEVGGDWYDAFMLPTGGLALTVGDVVGHDLYAASTMGQLRSMVQALACQPGAEPATVLTALNRLSAHLRVGELATVVHGRLTPPANGDHASLTWANAGHPPPLLLSPDAPAKILDQPPAPLLGLSESDYRQASLVMPAGAILLLYTDGLMEDPERPNADAISELAKAAQEHVATGLEELCDRLIAAAPARDDIALLAVRVIP